MTLNEIAKDSYKSAKKRQENGAKISAEPIAMLKHCATEVVEATEAYKELCLRDSEDSLPRLKNNFASELADVICCCAIIAYYTEIDLDTAISKCLEKNRKRAEKIGDKL